MFPERSFPDPCTRELSSVYSNPRIPGRYPRQVLIPPRKNPRLREGSDLFEPARLTRGHTWDPCTSTLSQVPLWSDPGPPGRPQIPDRSEDASQNPGQDSKLRNQLETSAAPHALRDASQTRAVFLGIRVEGNMFHATSSPMNRVETGFQEEQRQRSASFSKKEKHSGKNGVIASIVSNFK